jgi:hypothetical protein
MAVSVTVAGVSYTIPQVGDVSWGNQVTAWIQAISSVTLQTTGGSFTLTNDLNFGPSFGLISKYFTSVASNPSASGVLRLATGDAVGWRNAANSGDILLNLDGSNNLQFNSTKVLLSGAVVNADINAAAAIAYSKLNLAGSILNSDVNAAAAIAYSKLNLSGSIVNADINSAAAIAYSKLNLSGSILNADINAAAAIAYSKLALTGSVKLGAGGDVTGVLPVANGGTGQGSVVSAPAATAWAGWDANKNLSANNFLEGYTTTATAAGTTALTVSSSFQQVFTGSTTQTVTMPVVSSLVLGQQYLITNLSSGVVTVQSSGANTIQAMAANTSLLLTCISTSGTGTASWTWSYANVNANTPMINPMTTGGDIIYGGGSGAATRLPNGSHGQFLLSAGSTNAPFWATLQNPTVQRLTSGTTYNLSYVFSVTSANATAGATYTNNGITYTVSSTISSGTTLVVTGNGDPTASGTLTKASGTGDATITFGFYQKPVYLRVRMIGGGGGGSGGGTTGSTGGNGGNTTFGSSLLTAGGGNAPAGFGQTGGTGGSNTVNSPAINIFSPAGANGGSGGFMITSNATYCSGGMGGVSPFGGAGAGGSNAAATAAQANTGSGGGGGGQGNTAANYAGGGGGAGGYVDAIIPSPSSTYTYSIGTAGSAGTSSANGFSGAAGAAGIIIVEEYYQ